MRKLRKFLALSHRERRLLLKAALTVAAVRLGLWLLPFKTLRHILDRLGRRGKGGPDPCYSSEALVRAVELTSSLVPEATCLTQALSAQLLLQRQGYPADLHIGVAREEGALRAHAWVELRGEVVIGEQGMVGCTPLAVMRGRGA